MAFVHLHKKAGPIGKDFLYRKLFRICCIAQIVAFIFLARRLP